MNSLNVDIKFKCCKHVQDIIILIDKNLLIDERSDWFDVTRIYYREKLENKFNVIGDLIYLEITD
jgi:hypothetical protein